VLGEAPGKNEVEKGAPFVGRSGEALNEALQGARDSTLVTNVRRCLPPEPDKQRVATIRHCRSAYLGEMLGRLPEVRTIVCVGGDALRQIVGIGEVTRVFGSVWSKAEAAAIRAVEFPEASGLRLPPKLHTVVAAIHPAAAMYGSRHLLPGIKQVIARGPILAAHDEDPIGDRLAGLSINLHPTEEEVQEMLNGGQHSPLVLDVETPRDKPTVIEMCGIACGDKKALVIDWREPYVGMVKRLLEDPERVVIGHNFSYDMRAFAAYGIEVQAKVLDSINAAAILWPPVPDRKAEEQGARKLTLPWLSLALCVMRMYDREAYWKEPESVAGQAFYRVAYPGYAPYEWPKLYCALDCLKNARLMVGLREVMQG
jgi:DNA polymerase